MITSDAITEDDISDAITEDDIFKALCDEKLIHEMKERMKNSLKHDREKTIRLTKNVTRSIFKEIDDILDAHSQM